jgi:hypothetical protein
MLFDRCNCAISLATNNLQEFKCNVSGSDDDLEYYVRECGDILGVAQKLPQDTRDAKHILEYIFAQVVEFKKLNQVSVVPL